MALATERHIRPVAFSPDETGITGPDPRDEVTLHQPGLVPDHLGALDENALVVESSFAMPNNRKGVSTHLLTAARTAGLEIVDPANFSDIEELLTSKAEKRVLDVDLPF
ncbi:uncharacterized protein EDB93DRAFT_1245140 [Suillus bovinus]|uniref:uncharacterized protein n=1 Tax=Suillus bovinus TaxID=48563 RepID=UPI001B877F6A|nr:uncharacterized protein EDB93DRAFT_1245140 [Suillus bovinus]KAG2159332.1 hypothetical protein EDB93DRAFT_1245140 [Suillus bovinus]